MGSRPNFRARPIVYTKALPIIKSDDDPFHDEDVNNQRDIPQVPTGMEAHETQEIHLINALRSSVFGSKKLESIPLPIFSRAKDYKAQKYTPWHRPAAQYIVFDRTDEDLMASAIDYSLDAVDDKFYNSLPERKRGSLTLEALEVAMDTLERLQGREKDLIPFQRAKPHLDSLISNDSTKLLVYNHWHARRVEFRSSFHRNFKPAVDPQEQSPAIAFRPRQDSASSARRQNTYENYKRLAALAPQFYALRDLLASVQSREDLKSSIAATTMLRTRIQCARCTARTASAFKALCTSSYEVALVHEPLLDSQATNLTTANSASLSTKGSTPLYIPLRGLDLPESVSSGLRKVPPPQRRRRSKVAGSSQTKTALENGPTPAASAGRSTPSGKSPGSTTGFSGGGQPLDQYGFDEQGTKFMRHMRYFAGGFISHGVCPYDHRVFFAASERNTVREDPRKPRPVSFPDDIPFAKEVRVHASETGGKYGYSASSVDRSSAPSSCKVKVRARVGRLGRIILDRVTYEPERGVKAASYPASIEMGGVYTGGLPLEHLADVLGDEFGEKAWNPQERKLIKPFKPMIPAKRKSPKNRTEDMYWPTKKRRVNADVRSPLGRSESCNLGDPWVSNNNFSSHPRYMSKARQLVEEV